MGIEMDHILLDRRPVTQAEVYASLLVWVLLVWAAIAEKKRGELIEEHEQLTGVLERDEPKEIYLELGKQKKELAELRKNPRTAKKLDPKKWEKAKKKAVKELGRHSARAMQRAVKYYKEMGGRYSGGKGEGMVKWTKQDWTTYSGEKAKRGKKYDRYLPRKVWEKLTPSEAKATRQKKLKESKQYVPNTKKVKALVSRANPEKTFVPPAQVAKEAAEGLRLRHEYHRAGTPVGIARARDLKNRRPISFSTIKRMRSYFARHEVDKQGRGFKKGTPGFPSNGWIAWLLWGGDSGRKWAGGIYEGERA